MRSFAGYPQTTTGLGLSAGFMRTLGLPICFKAFITSKSKARSSFCSFWYLLIFIGCLLGVDQWLWWIHCNVMESDLMSYWFVSLLSYSFDTSSHLDDNYTCIFPQASLQMRNFVSHWRMGTQEELCRSWSFKFEEFATACSHPSPAKVSWYHCYHMHMMFQIPSLSSWWCHAYHDKHCLFKISIIWHCLQWYCFTRPLYEALSTPALIKGVLRWRIDTEDSPLVDGRRGSWNTSTRRVADRLPTTSWRMNVVAAAR